jgi:hypothetical protein
MMEKRRIILAGLTCVLLVALAAGLGYAQGRNQSSDEPVLEERVESRGQEGPRDSVPAEGDTALQNPRSWRIAGSAMHPRAGDVVWSQGAHEGCTYAASGNAVRSWTAPLHLPDGAVLKLVRMYYYDTSAAQDCEGFLTVYDYYGEAVAEWEMESTGDSGYALDNTGVFTHTVDNDLYSYVLRWRPNALGAGMQGCGFRVFYDSPGSAAFLPAVPRAHSESP